MKKIHFLAFQLAFFSLLVSISFTSRAQLQLKPEALKKGDRAPSFVSTDYKNRTVRLDDLTHKGKVVLVFYRGQWCPYCNRYLSALQDSLQQITAKGASVIAISPEVAANVEKTIDKTKATFTIIPDKDYKLSRLYKTAYAVDAITLDKMKKYGIDMEAAHGNKEINLPVPATYVIDQSGTIIFADFDPNYKHRPSVKNLLQAL